MRIDTVEQASENSGHLEKDLIGPEGYLISYAIAKENLGLGLTVIADSVIPLQ